jgi:tetratricopeptide (TPR) repeat protein
MTTKEAQTHYWRYKVLYRNGEYSLALEEADAAVAADPSFALAYVSRGYVLRKLGRRDEALAAAGQALALAPDNPFGLSVKGAVLGELGRDEEAREAFERALAVAGEQDRPALHYDFACFWAGRGAADECREQLETAVALNPRFKIIAAADRDFDVFAKTAWFRNIVALTR